MNAENMTCKIFPWIEYGMCEKELENSHQIRLYRKIADRCYQHITSQKAAFFDAPLYYCLKGDVNVCMHDGECEMIQANDHLQKLASNILKEYRRVVLCWEQFLGFQNTGISDSGLIFMKIKRKHKAYIKAHKKYDTKSFLQSLL